MTETTDPQRREAFEKAIATAENDGDGMSINDWAQPPLAEYFFNAGWQAALTSPSAEAKPGLTESEANFLRSLLKALRHQALREPAIMQDSTKLDAIISRLTTGGQKS